MFNQRRRTRGWVLVGLIVCFVFLAGANPQAGEASPLATTTTVGLGTAGNFAVLGGSAVNDTNPSTVTGNVGLSPASWLSALTCGEVTGTIYSVDGAGPLPCRITNAGLLTIAKNDLTTAYNNAAGRAGATVIATELGGQTLIDGVYVSASTTFLLSGGTLTLNGSGNADSVFIFKMASDTASLTTLSNSKMSLINGAQACNVFWQVGGSAVFGTGTTFAGTVMANQSITDNGGSTVNGRFLARIAAVTLNNTRISIPPCTTQAAIDAANAAAAAAAKPKEVPEADTLLLLGGGLGGLSTWMGWQWRKMRKRSKQ